MGVTGVSLDFKCDTPEPRQCPFGLWYTVRMGCSVQFDSVRRGLVGVAFALFASGVFADSTAYDLGADFAKDAAWDVKGAEFVAAHRVNRFRFLEEGKETAANAVRAGNVRFHGLEVYETRMWFDAEGVSRIELSLYNRGDAGKALDAADLAEMLNTVRTALGTEGEKPPDVESKNVGGGAQQKMQAWSAPRAAQLTWRMRKLARGRVEVDFVRVTLLSPRTNPVMRGTSAKGKAAIRKNVVKVTAATAEEGRTKDGDVYIANVPMVDQGQKGYCAVATSERVLRYYGHDVDEHELGASAGSSAEGGTSVKAMYDTVAAAARKYGLGTYLVYGELDKGVGGRIEDLEKQVADYNKAAKKLRRPEIPRSRYVRDGHVWDAGAARAAMEADVLKAMKLKHPKYRGFVKALHDQVNAGNPLFWGVTLGLYPEEDIPQARGGHMRLIIGYNDRTKEIVYTDSWGAGHEYKRMPLDVAWAIADAVLYLKPNRK